MNAQDDYCLPYYVGAATGIRSPDAVAAGMYPREQREFRPLRRKEVNFDGIFRRYGEKIGEK